jgi:hypothetical protein
MYLVKPLQALEYVMSPRIDRPFRLPLPSPSLHLRNRLCFSFRGALFGAPPPPPLLPRLCPPSPGVRKHEGIQVPHSISRVWKMCPRKQSRPPPTTPTPPLPVLSYALPHLPSSRPPARRCNVFAPSPPPPPSTPPPPHHPSPPSLSRPHPALPPSPSTQHPSIPESLIIRLLLRNASLRPPILLSCVVAFVFALFVS